MRGEWRERMVQVREGNRGRRRTLSRWRDREKREGEGRGSRDMRRREGMEERRG